MGRKIEVKMVNERDKLVSQARKLKSSPDTAEITHSDRDLLSDTVLSDSETKSVIQVYDNKMYLHKIDQ